METASNGQDAIGKLDSFFPDIVLLDISLPDMNEFDILSIIRSENRFQQMFVILCTGMMTSREHRNYGLKSGANDYLYKPVTADVLLARIKAMIRIKETEHKLRNINKTLETKVEKEQLHFSRPIKYSKLRSGSMKKPWKHSKKPRKTWSRRLQTEPFSCKKPTGSCEMK